MRAKLRDGNQLRPPGDVAKALDGIECLDIEARLGCLVLTPVRGTTIDDIHDKLAKLRITEQDVADAVAWARRCGGKIAPDN